MKQMQSWNVQWQTTENFNVREKKFSLLETELQCSKVIRVLGGQRLLVSTVICDTGFPGGSDSNEHACNAGDPGSILGWERSPGEGNGDPLQYSCLENPMDRGAWWAIVPGVTESLTGVSD